MSQREIVVLGAKAGELGVLTSALANETNPLLDFYWMPSKQVERQDYPYLFDVRWRTVRRIPPERSPMNDPEIYSWYAAYQCAVLEADSSLMAERIFAALVAIARRLRTPILIDGPEHTAMKTARRGLAVLQAEGIELQSDIVVPLVWHPANRN